KQRLAMARKEPSVQTPELQRDHDRRCRHRGDQRPDRFAAEAKEQRGNNDEEKIELRVRGKLQPSRPAAKQLRPRQGRLRIRSLPQQIPDQAAALFPLRPLQLQEEARMAFDLVRPAVKDLHIIAKQFSARTLECELLPGHRERLQVAALQSNGLRARLEFRPCDNHQGLQRRQRIRPVSGEVKRTPQKAAPSPAGLAGRSQGKYERARARPAKTLKKVDQQNNEKKCCQLSHCPCDAACWFGSSILSSLPKIARHAFLMAPAIANIPTMMNFHSLASSPVLSATAAPPPTIRAVKPYSATLSPFLKSL